MTNRNRNALDCYSVVFPFLILLSIGGFYLWSTDNVGILGVLLALAFLLFQIIHIFMHHIAGGPKEGQTNHSDHQGGPS